MYESCGQPVKILDEEIFSAVILQLAHTYIFLKNLYFNKMIPY
jgi:hypothetical protein